MGRTRSPSGCKEEKLAGVCVSAEDLVGTASVTTEAAAVENRKLRRETSCVARFSAKFIGKEGWLLDASNVKNLGSSRRRRRIAQRNVSSPAHGLGTSLCDTLQMLAPRVSIDDGLKKKCARVALGCVTAEVQAGETPTKLSEELKSREDEILRLPEPRAVLESVQVLATRAAYKSLGKDPARYRGSAEALLRRVVANKGLPRINAVVDVINLVSVESRLPVGLYDLAAVSGDIVFRAGRAGETYKGIGKYDLNLEGLPLFADAVGPHGSATSDSERTMVTASTKNIVAMIVSFGGAADLPRWTQRMCELLTLYAAAKNCESSVIS
jgi:DNA/RNA-binding domain of Phe-tRNA-synthetase-like protein